MKKGFFAFLAIVAFSAAFAQQKIEVKSAGKPVTNGWADLGKLSYAKADKITVIDDEAYPDPVKKRKAFTSAISGGRFVVLKGDVDLSDGKINDNDHSYFDEFGGGDGKRLHADIMFSLGSGTTLIGSGNARIMYGGIRCKDASNIIIRNVTFYDAHGSTEYDTKKKGDSKASIDNLVLENCSDVWVDHCTFTDGVCVDLTRNYNHDGSFDIKIGRKVTVSYCEFTNHDKVMLVGSGEAYTNPSDRSVTLHHNYFHGVVQRLPRTRGTYMHIYNNLYDGIGTSGNSGYSLGPGTGAQFIVENNFFGKRMSNIVMFMDQSKSKNDSTFAKFYHSGNIPNLDDSNVTCSERAGGFKAHEMDKKPWEIKYSYTLEDASGLPASIPKNAGAGRIVVIDGKEY